MLSVWWNRFHVCSACASYDFRKLLKNTKLKCKFWPKIIENLKSRLGTHLKGSVKWKKRGGMNGINRWAFNLSTIPQIFYRFLKDPGPLNHIKPISAA
jgi:hypothetical protein